MNLFPPFRRDQREFPVLFQLGELLGGFDLLICAAVTIPFIKYCLPEAGQYTATLLAVFALVALYVVISIKDLFSTYLKLHLAPIPFIAINVAMVSTPFLILFTDDIPNVFTFGQKAILFVVWCITAWRMFQGAISRDKAVSRNKSVRFEAYSLEWITLVVAGQGCLIFFLMILGVLSWPYPVVGFVAGFMGLTSFAAQKLSRFNLRLSCYCGAVAEPLLVSV